MALNPSTNGTMSGRITAPDANYPYGSSKDETSAGAGDGTPYFKSRADDIFGFQQALLVSSAIVPSGNADTAVESECMKSVVELASGRAFNYDEEGTSAADAYVIEPRSGQHGVGSLFDDLKITFRTAFANTGAAATIDLSLLLGESLGTTIKNIKLSGGADPAAGDIDGRTEIVYDSANGWFEVQQKIVGVVSSGSNANGTWRVWSDGTIEQWGNGSVSTTTAAIVFPIPFTTSVDSITGVGASADTNTVVVKVRSGLTTLTQFSTIANGDHSFNFYAKGV